MIVRRERPYPGAQLSFTAHDRHRFQAILTDQPDEGLAVIERRHRQRAHIEDRIRDDNDTGLAKFPLQQFSTQRPPSGSQPQSRRPRTPGPHSRQGG